VQTSESSAFSPGEDVFLIARITVLRQQFRAKIAWVGLHGMGVKFQMLELDSGKSAHATDENESLEEERRERQDSETGRFGGNLPEVVMLSTTGFTGQHGAPLPTIRILWMLAP
jgi:hypothetical protein